MKKTDMINRLVERHGAKKATMIMTVISMTMSMIPSVIVSFFLYNMVTDNLFIISIAMAVIIPGIIAPVVSHRLYTLIEQLNAAKLEKERLISELQEATANVKILSGLLPICASCKKIRDDNGYWNKLETYIHKHSEAKFSHGICPDCMKELYPEYCKEIIQ